MLLSLAAPLTLTVLTFVVCGIVSGDLRRQTQSAFLNTAVREG